MLSWTGVAIFFGAIAFMEIVAYVAHRWVMHGFLWSLHKSHHEPRDGWFEKNDWFAVMGATPAVALILYGSITEQWSYWWLGMGITAYGAIYFGFHDMLVHRRIKHGWNPQNRYLKRIIQAHRLHHVVESKHGTVSFGFLYAPPVRDLLAQLEASGAGKLRSNKLARDMAVSEVEV